MWGTDKHFGYGFTFRQIGIFGFTSAFDVVNIGGPERAVGAVLIDNCVINRNRWIARNLDSTHFNGFRFVNNKAGQNGYIPQTGGLDIAGNDITIENNILEANRDAVRISGDFRDIIVKGNYFEGNAGHACIELRDIAGPYMVGPNNFGLLDYKIINHKVLLRTCRLGTCVDPYWPDGVHKLPPPLYGGSPATRLKNDLDSTRYGYLRLDRLDGENWCARPQAMRFALGHGGGELIREEDPSTGHPTAARLHQTSGNGQIEFELSLSGNANEWAVVSWLFRPMSIRGDRADPYLSIKVNERAAGGARDYPIYGFGAAWADAEWSLLTAAIRLEAPMTKVLAVLFPFGIKPTAGLETHHFPPMVYTIEDIGKVRPFFDGYRAGAVERAPTAGNWFAGDILRLASPKPNATQVLCVETGSPGRWIST